MNPEPGTPTMMDRRDILTAAGAVVLAGLTPLNATSHSGGTMYGLIGKMSAVPGQRDALAAILLEGTPGCPDA